MVHNGRTLTGVSVAALLYAQYECDHGTCYFFFTKFAVGFLGSAELIIECPLRVHADLQH